MADNSQMFSL